MEAKYKPKLKGNCQQILLTVNVNKIKLWQLALVGVLSERPDDLHDGGGLAGAGDAADVHAAARALAQLGLGEAQNLGELVLAARQRVGHGADVEAGLELRVLLFRASITGFIVLESDLNDNLMAMKYTIFSSPLLRTQKKWEKTSKGNKGSHLNTTKYC